MSANSLIASNVLSTDSETSLLNQILSIRLPLQQENGA
jgi:hypothetical protein